MSKDAKQTLKDLVNGIKDKFANAIKADPTLGGDIEKLHTLLAEQTTPPPPAGTQVKTKDGKILSVEGEMKAGSKINLVDAGGTATPAPDGSYELEDGTILTVTGGLITDAKAPAPPTTTPPAPDAAMLAKMKAHEDTIKALETRLSDSEKSRNELISVFKRLQEIPIDTKMSKEKKEVTEEEYNKMSKLEQRRYWRDQGETTK